MKTANMKKELKGWVRASLFFGMTALTVLMTACGKSDSGSPAAVPYYGTYGVPYGAQYNQGMYGSAQCSGCSGYGMIASAIGRNNLGDELYLDIYGEPNRVAQMQAYGITQYYGPAAAVGTFLTPTGVSYCGVPAGQYQISSSSPGQWGMDGAGRSGQLQLIAQGPVQFQIMVYYAQLNNSMAIQGRNGRQYQYTMATRMFINGDSRCEITTF